VSPGGRTCPVNHEAESRVINSVTVLIILIIFINIFGVCNKLNLNENFDDIPHLSKPYSSPFQVVFLTFPSHIPHLSKYFPLKYFNKENL